MEQNTHFVIGIRNKIPYKISGPDYIVTDNSDYTLELVPDEQWEGLDAKTVYYAFDLAGAIVHPIVGNHDAVPKMTKPGVVYIGVSAGDIRTTRPLAVKVASSIRNMAGVEIPEPEPEVYDRIMEMINNHETRIKRLEAGGTGGGGGGTDITLGITGAVVGQTVKITEVDENGKPVKWEAADIESGGTSDAVQYVEQELTDEQQVQARENLGLYRKTTEYPMIGEYGSAAGMWDWFDGSPESITECNTVMAKMGGTTYITQLVHEVSDSIRPETGNMHSIMFQGNSKLLPIGSGLLDGEEYNTDVPFVVYEYYNAKTDETTSGIEFDADIGKSGCVFYDYGNPTEVYHPIPEEYIPESIARKEELDEVSEAIVDYPEINFVPVKTRIAAHRGDMESYPENTIPAFRSAGEKGAWGIETDVRVTSDGHLVCIHNSTVDATTNGTGNVSGFTLAELQALDIDYGEAYGSYTGEKLSVPLFSDYLDICRKYGCVALVHLQNDLSGDTYIRNVYDAVKAAGMLRSAVFQSWDIGQMQKVRAIDKSVMVCPAYNTITTAEIDAIVAVGSPVAIHVNTTSGVTNSVMEYAHNNGVYVFSGFGVTNDPFGSLEYWTGVGVDVITSTYLSYSKLTDLPKHSKSDVEKVLTVGADGIPQWKKLRNGESTETAVDVGTWVLGNISGGTEYDRLNRIRTVEYLSFSSDSIKVIPADGYQFSFHEYDADKNWVSSSAAWIGEETMYTLTPGWYYRFNLKRVDDGDMTSDEGQNLVVYEINSETAIVKSVNGIFPDENGNVEIDIPDGGGSGGSDVTLGISGATVGQIARITAVDENGAPTAWESVSDSGNTGGWEKIGDIDVTQTFEFSPISFADGIVTLDINAENYDFMASNCKVVFHPIKIDSDATPIMYQLRPLDYAAGTFNVYNIDGVQQTTAKIDVAVYKMSVPNISTVVFSDVPDCDRYKVRISTPVMMTHGLRAPVGCNIALGIDAMVQFEKAGGVILEKEIIPLTKDFGYVIGRQTIWSSGIYGAKSTADGLKLYSTESIKPKNGLVEFTIVHCPFVNGTKFELWGANDV